MSRVTSTNVTVHASQKFGASGIVAFVKFTKGGIAIRATAEDQSTAYSMGISVPKVFSRAWVLASTTGAIAGAILATRNGISPSLGLFGFSVLAIVLMGGLDSYIGVLIAAMVVGVERHSARPRSA